MGKTGVLLLNLGGPETLDDVEPFLFNLFSDPELLRVPFPFLQKALAKFISKTRAAKSKKNYAAIGGGSPLLRITREQAQALQSHLESTGIPAQVFVAMRYWHPFTENVVQDILAAQITKLVVLPLYPQYSLTTTGSSFKLLDQLWNENPALASIERVMINSWYDQPDYVAAMASSIVAQIDQFEDPEKVHVLFSAHGIPESYVTAFGDPYQQEIEASVRLIWSTVQRSNPHSLSYQSRVGVIKWLGPYTDNAIPALGEGGLRQLLVVPISFVSEHIETLEEIDMEYRHLAEKSGIKVFRRVPALDSHPQFIQGLAELVRPHLTEPAQVSELQPA